MSTAEFWFNMVMAVVNGFSLLFIVCHVSLKMKTMDAKLERNMVELKHLANRSHQSWLFFLIQMQKAAIQNEDYETAAKLKKIIDEGMQEPRKEGNNSKVV